MSSENLIVSVSGIRGIVGQGLTADAATAFASALGTHLQGAKVTLSRDGRPSGLMLRHAVLAGLLEAGCDVTDLGVTPTPTVGFAIRRLQAAGGIQITASHNPAPWNGLKLFGPDGRILSAVEGKKVQALFENRAFRCASWERIGTLSEARRADDWHRERVLELVDVARIRARGLKVFLDANGGAGGPLGRRLLDALHCRPVVHGGDADGFFLHEPEPIAENLKTVGPLVVQNDADAGFVLDPDADRLALIDEQGRFLGEELTLALAVQFRLRAQPGPVVVNMSTSRVSEDLCKQFRVPFHRAAVGEANVADKMIEVGAVIGGEGNGGVIDPRVGFVRDPFIGMGLILNLMAETDKQLSELAAELPVYHIVKDKYTVASEGLSKLFDALTARWPEAAVNRLDGLRLDWKDRWVHVRPSNTEPIVRVIAEAPQAADAEHLCREVGKLLQSS
ncbi:MAG TPA: phosphoglucosamine mutase [Gemmataceae bacterium]